MWQTGNGFCEPLCQLQDCTTDASDPNDTCTCREDDNRNNEIQWGVKCKDILGPQWQWDHWTRCVPLENTNGDVDCVCTYRCVYRDSGATHVLVMPDANPCPD